MTRTNTLTDYDTNAADYDQFRRPSSLILEKITNTFSNTEGIILSMGCGTGMYEGVLSQSMLLVGLDKSHGMLNQAKGRAIKLLRGDMTSLPVADNSISGAYFMHSLHHIGANTSISAEDRNQARKRVLHNVFRVMRQGRILIFQRDPSQNKTVWFWKYFPKALSTKLLIQPQVATLETWLIEAGFVDVAKTPINDPMIRGFYNPEAPLDSGFRRSFSEFSYLSEEDVYKGVRELRMAIQDGSVNNDIERCRRGFASIGGTVYMLSASKMR